MINGGLLNPVESQDKVALENVKIKGRKKKDFDREGNSKSKGLCGSQKAHND